MDRNPLDELIRRAEPAGPSASTVDRLVTGALHRGRRSLVLRRMAAGIACGALLTTGAAVAGQLPGRGVEAAPAAPSATATPTPARSASVAAPTPAAPTNTPAGTTGPPPSHLDVLKVLRPALPKGSKVSQIGDDDLVGQVSVMFTMTDADGRAFVAGGVYNDLEDLPCTAGDGCTQETLAGGNLSVMRDPGGSRGKAGDGTWYYFERSDGSWIWFGQRNAFEGNGPVTRPEVPLGDPEVRQLLTAPAWESLVERCRAARDSC